MFPFSLSVRKHAATLDGRYPVLSTGNHHICESISYAMWDTKSNWAFIKLLSVVSNVTNRENWMDMVRVYCHFLPGFVNVTTLINC